MTPTITARMVATFDQLSNGRLLINVVAGGDPVELAGVTWGEPPADVVAKIEAVRKAATSLGRSLRFGLRVHIIVRETERQAWEAADDLLRYVSDESIAAVAARLKEYAALGIDTFILSGYPHLEEAYRVAELLFPLLSVDHRPKRTAASYVGPFGDLKPGS
jgi:alkanesulfonate monooxygenase